MGWDDTALTGMVSPQEAAEMHSLCGWTPLDGWQVHERVVLRRKEVFLDGQILV